MVVILPFFLYSLSVKLPSTLYQTNWKALSDYIPRLQRKWVEKSVDDTKKIGIDIATITDTTYGKARPIINTCATGAGAPPCDHSTCDDFTRLPDVELSITRPKAWIFDRVGKHFQ